MKPIEFTLTVKLRRCLFASAAAASLVLPVEGRSSTCPPSHDPEIVPLTPNGDGRFSARVTLGEGPASRTLDMIIDTGAAISGVPADDANALIAAKQAVEPKRLLTLANGARENERTIGITTVTVGHYVAHQAVAAVINGTPLLGLPVLRQIGRFTIDAAYEQLILNELIQCKTPSEAALQETDEARAQVTEMKAPLNSSKAQALATPSQSPASPPTAPPPIPGAPPKTETHPASPGLAEEEKDAPPARDLTPAPVGWALPAIEDFPQYKFARSVQELPVARGPAAKRPSRRRVDYLRALSRQGRFLDSPFLRAARH